MSERTITKQMADEALAFLRPFIGAKQRLVLAEQLRGEERDFFRQMLFELAARVAAMPQSYETDGQGGKAIAYLHYFAGGCANWWITEKDKGEGDDKRQLQAFGRADLFMDGGEIGYISIEELLQNDAELDLYWEPKTLEEVEAKHPRITG